MFSLNLNALLARHHSDCERQVASTPITSAATATLAKEARAFATAIAKAQEDLYRDDGLRRSVLDDVWALSHADFERTNTHDNALLDQS